MIRRSAIGYAPRPSGGRTRRAARRDAGFTLLEMLVAVLVLATLASVVPRGLVAARTNLERSEDWLDARLVAETVLNEALAGRSLKPGVIGGVVDGRRWRATLRRMPTAVDEEAETNWVLLDVKIEVAITGRKMLEVDTMRIGTLE
jgi:prepilin-type N-terminal cleavage/methylation domain-containing protein